LSRGYEKKFSVWARGVHVPVSCRSEGLRFAASSLRGFQLALPFNALLNAAIRTSSYFTRLRGAPHTALPYAAGRRQCAAFIVLPASRAARRRAWLPPAVLEGVE